MDSNRCRRAGPSSVCTYTSTAFTSFRGSVALLYKRRTPLSMDMERIKIFIEKTAALCYNVSS